MTNATADRVQTKQDKRGKGYLPQHNVKNRRHHGDAQKIVVKYMIENGDVTQQQVMKLLGYSHITSAANVLRKMIRKGILDMKVVNGINHYSISTKPDPKRSKNNKPTSTPVVEAHEAIQPPSRIKQWVNFVNENPGATANDVILAFNLIGTYISTTVSSTLHNEAIEGRLKQTEENGETHFYGIDYDPNKAQVDEAEPTIKEVSNEISEGTAIDKITEVMEALNSQASAARVLKYIGDRFI